MFVVIFNHNHNAESIALRKAFASVADTCLLDSGSNLTDDERTHFDECHPKSIIAPLNPAAF